MEGKPGVDFSDMDQGWQLNGVIKEGKVYFLESDDSYPVDLETSEIFNNVCIDLEHMQSEVQKNEPLVKGIIEKLTAEIGVDVWTKYHYKDNFNFGTANWKPRKGAARKSLFHNFFKR